MSDGIRDLYQIPRAKADIGVRLGMLLMVRGSLRKHAEAVGNLYRCMRFTVPDARFSHYRFLSDIAWRTVPSSVDEEDFCGTFAFPAKTAGCWGVEFTRDIEGCASEGEPFLEIMDLVPVNDVERASYVRLLFDAKSSASHIASLANWTINNFPVWWGCAGWLFEHTAGATYPAFSEIAAKAKRHWGIQIQDMTALQWDALRGMPGINWLNLIGNEFAGNCHLDLNEITSRIKEANSGVFHRTGDFGIVIAAGSKPLTGDINQGEDIGAYSDVANLIAALLLTKHTLLTGPFGRPEVLSAWLGRFTSPQAWLECEITG